MARINTGARTRRAATSPVRTVARGYTHEGGIGYVKDEKSELYTLGVNLFAGGEKTFYESGADRDQRFVNLVGSLAVSDPAWTNNFLHWLRVEGNMRTAPVMGAAAAIHARLESGQSFASDNGIGYNRQVANVVCQRLDEPMELFAVYAELYGKPFPQALKRGAGDAVQRLATEYAVQKYDTASKGWRLGDVIQLAHINPESEAQAALFRFAIANRHGNVTDELIVPELLPMISSNKRLRREAVNDPNVLLDPDYLRAAGFTWEDALSLAGNRIPKDKLWNALILSGQVGYMAMLRNLRNFQEAGISQQATELVIAKLSDPQAVAKSKQFPFRFLSAYENAQGTQWVHALEEALKLSVVNIPELDGDSVVLIDTSASMSDSGFYGHKQTRAPVKSAALFGAAVALRNPGRVRLHTFASATSPEIRVSKGGSILRLTDSIVRSIGSVGHGTETTRAVLDTYAAGDKRVFVFTDGQSFGNVYGSPDQQVEPNTFFYAWDLGGYANGDVDTGSPRVHQFAGLTDKTFQQIPLLERGVDARWPWE